MPDARRLLIDFAIMAGIGLLLALLGPFGSFEAPLALRLAYWLLLAFGGYFLYLPAMAAAHRLSQRLDLPEGPLWAGACLAATVPMSVLVWSANSLWGPLRVPDPARALAHYGNVLVVGGAVCLLFWFAGRRRETEAASTPDAVSPGAGTPPAPRLLDRLPPRLRADILALEMEDHYVRVHTATGSTLLLMRLRDAIEELEGLAGAQVHRSWWVARAAVADVRRDGRNVRLALASGVEVPVARGRTADLAAAGWLD